MHSKDIKNIGGSDIFTNFRILTFSRSFYQKQPSPVPLVFPLKFKSLLVGQREN